MSQVVCVGDIITFTAMSPTLLFAPPVWTIVNSTNTLLAVNKKFAVLEPDLYSIVIPGVTYINDVFVGGVGIISITGYTGVSELSKVNKIKVVHVDGTGTALLTPVVPAMNPMGSPDPTPMFNLTFTITATQMIYNTL